MRMPGNCGSRAIDAFDQSQSGELARVDYLAPKSLLIFWFHDRPPSRLLSSRKRSPANAACLGWMTCQAQAFMPRSAGWAHELDGEARVLLLRSWERAAGPAHFSGINDFGDDQGIA
jgi:hypothetical protein